MLEITVDRLTKDFGPIPAVDNVSFEVKPGRVVGFIGPNVSGKTTTLRMLLGLVTPSSGEARIGGRRFSDLEDPARQVGAVLEARAFHPGRTARDHLRVIATEARISHRRVDDVLALVGLDGAVDRRAGTFSLGIGPAPFARRRIAG